MKRCDEKDVQATQAVVAVHHRRQNQAMPIRWRRPGRTQDRQPEVKMFVVFSQYDLVLGRAVDLEDANALRIAARSRSGELRG